MELLPSQFSTRALSHAIYFLKNRRLKSHKCRIKRDRRGIRKSKDCSLRMESVPGSKMVILILKLILNEPESLCSDECRAPEQGVGEAAKGMESDKKAPINPSCQRVALEGRSHTFLAHIYHNHGLTSVTDIYCTKRPLKLTWQIPKAIPSPILACPVCQGHRSGIRNSTWR